MKPLDSILTTIASQHLGIPTLETRHSDSLDFHDVSVCGAKNALQAAFDAGAASAGITATTPKALAVMEFIVADIDEGVKDLGCWHRLLSAAIAEAKPVSRQLITAAPVMLEALRLARRALNADFHGRKPPHISQVIASTFPQNLRISGGPV